MHQRILVVEERKKLTDHLQVGITLLVKIIDCLLTHLFFFSLHGFKQNKRYRLAYSKGGKKVYTFGSKQTIQDI